MYVLVADLGRWGYKTLACLDHVQECVKEEHCVLRACSCLRVELHREERLGHVHDALVGKVIRVGEQRRPLIGKSTETHEHDQSSKRRTYINNHGRKDPECEYDGEGHGRSSSLCVDREAVVLCGDIAALVPEVHHGDIVTTVTEW